MMKTFHNGTYAKCDAALPSYGICSNISTLSRERQDRQRTAFHNARIVGGGAWALLCQDRLGGHPGGKIGGCSRAPHPPAHILRLLSLGPNFIFGLKSFGRV